MNTIEYIESPLLAQFRGFYNEVIRQKQWVELNNWRYSPERVTEENRDPASLVHSVQQPLLSLLERQELEARRRGGEYGWTLYKDAQYVMVALADEVFLHMEWVGQDPWEANLLESQLFKSHDAGERLFEKLDKLLQERDPNDTELAHVYLMTLALGFRGKFWDVDDEGKLDSYRRELFSFVSRRHPDLREESKNLFPEAYAHTLDEGRIRKLRDVRKWIGWLVFAILAWLVISSVLWFGLTEEFAGRGVDDILDMILEQYK